MKTLDRIAVWLMSCVKCLVFKNFQTSLGSLLVVLSDTIPPLNSLHIVSLSFNFDARAAYIFEVIGVNISGKSEN